MNLVPCPACNRHVKAGSVCAFCGAALEGEGTPERTMPGERLGRAAIAAFGVTAVAAAAALAAACGDASSNTVVKTPTPDADGGQPQEIQRHQGGGGNNMPYGAPPANGLIKRVV